MYDAIVIGARCAGSATALLLARQGHRVLLLDKDDFPSDRVISTHLIWHAGVAALKRMGLLDRVKATGCQSMKKNQPRHGRLRAHRLRTARGWRG